MGYRYARCLIRESFDYQLLVGGDAEGFHLAVEVGAFEAEGFGGAGYVAVAAV